MAAVEARWALSLPWLNDRRVWTTDNEAHFGNQVERDAAEGLVLFALRKGNLKETQSGYSMTPPDVTKEHPGVMLWIEPVP